MQNTKKFYSKRFNVSENLNRKQVWKILCETYFQKFVRKNDFVVDVGAGYCEFINNINCRKKVAIDINPDTKILAKKDVTVISSKASKRQKKLKGKADIVFISNFLEHLENKDEVLNILENANYMLRKRGKILILQPNIDLVKERYWDFIDHKVALNSKSVLEALNICGFEVTQTVERFLPYTSKNRFLPLASVFLHFYLLIPPLLRPWAGQSFFVATKK